MNIVAANINFYICLISFIMFIFCIVEAFSGNPKPEVGWITLGVFLYSLFNLINCINCQED